MVLQSESWQTLTIMLIAPMAEFTSSETSEKGHAFTCRGGLVEGDDKENPQLKSQKSFSGEENHAKIMENKKKTTSTLTVTVEPPTPFDTISKLVRVSEHDWQVTEIEKEVPCPPYFGENIRTPQSYPLVSHV